MDGEHIYYPDILFEGKNFFRKMTDVETEKNICKYFMKNEHENIVKIYDVKETHIDMELLNIFNYDYGKTIGLNDTHFIEKNKIIDVMKNVKTFLQSIGIVYINWKYDNLGISNDGKIKLFDFCAAGLINKKGKWVKKCPEYWNYKLAVSALSSKTQNVIALDNYSFNFLQKMT